MMSEETALEVLPWKKEMSTPATRRGLRMRVSSLRTSWDLRLFCSAVQDLRMALCSEVKGMVLAR
jgi:hypothetical protein